MKKEFYLVEAINIVSWFNELSDEKKNSIPLKVHYALKKIVDKLSPDVKRFQDFRDEELKKVQDLYFTEDRSEECVLPQLDDDGNERKDDEGNVITEPGRKLKPEWEEPYQDAIDALDEKLKEVLIERNTYEFNKVDVGAMVENLPDDCQLENTDIDIIDAVFEENESTKG